SSNTPIRYRVSLDRKRLLQLLDDEEELLCRSTEDFRVLWKRRIDPAIDLNGTRFPQKSGRMFRSVTYITSPDGETIAVGAYRMAPDASGRVVAASVEILDAQDGSMIAKLPMDSPGIALSPNRKFLAIARLKGSEAGWQPTAHIYDIASGKEVAR